MCPKDAEDDSLLVEACIKRDDAAWAGLVGKYSELIALSIANRLKKYGFDPLCEDAEDIRQNILSSIWSGGKLELVRNRKSIAHWLSIVSGNAAIEHMRKKIGDRTPKFTRLTETIETAEVDDAHTAAKNAAGNELVGAIKRSIASLPSKERLVIKLNLLHGMEYRQVAEILNLPKGTVSSYIKRAKDKLKKELKDF